jgi:hypothetical protein
MGELKKAETYRVLKDIRHKCTNNTRQHLRTKKLFMASPVGKPERPARFLSGFDWIGPEIARPVEIRWDARNEPLHLELYDIINRPSFY